MSYQVFDGDLTELGRRQADDLGRRIRDRETAHPSIVVSSPLRRARQTAEIVRAYLPLARSMELEDLREVNVGSLDGRSDEASWSSYTLILDAWRRGHLEKRFPHGESGKELCERLRRALTVVALTSPDSLALVVAHGANLRSAIPWLTGQTDPGSDLGPAAMAILDVQLRDAGLGPIGLVAWNVQG